MEQGDKMQDMLLPPKEVKPAAGPTLQNAGVLNTDRRAAIRKANINGGPVDMPK
jgi:hypothetical protein